MRPASPVTASPKLGQILIEQGAVSPRQLEHGLAEQRALQLPIGRTLLALNHISEDALHDALARQCGIPLVALGSTAIDPSLARVISRRYARRHALVPIARSGSSLTVAMEDPTARSVIEELGRLTGFEIAVVTATGRDIQRAMRRLYETRGGTDQQWSTSGDALASRSTARAGLGGLDEQRSRRADELFRRVLRLALESRCSDIHLETLRTGLQLRFRVDGVLRQPSLGDLQDALDRNTREVVSRIKILSALDIAERRRPQDGSFQVFVERDGRMTSVDLRVSVVPCHGGESVVIRILDRSRAPRTLADLDLSPGVAERLEAVLRRTTGVFLVTGPTGSGKSTTLYSCLMRLHRPGIRILTAEDPVEYVYDELSQSQVNPEIGNTFASYLRAFLRHDPEVIMVGEIRDEETAAMSFRAAQTGHLLLSTLHTNTAVAALPRLLDLKVDASLIASSLIGVLSQRLARRTCAACRQAYEPPADVLAELVRERPDGWTFYRGAGCAACGFAGYRGRMLIADLWMPDDEDLLLINRRASFDEVRRSAARTTFSMAADAYERLCRGDTTPEELLRVLPYAAIQEMRARTCPPSRWTGSAT